MLDLLCCRRGDLKTHQLCSPYSALVGLTQHGVMRFMATVEQG